MKCFAGRQLYVPLGQIDGVEYVDFQVNGEPLTDLEGKEIGLMNEDQFIENAGEEINAYKTADLTLYFSNKAGDKLVEQRVAMEYNSNISLEKLNRGATDRRAAI